MNLKFIISLSLFFLLTACATNKYINQSADQYAYLSCEINQEDDCGIMYGKNGKDGNLQYKVEALGNNKYAVKGIVQLDPRVVGGMNPKIIFYVLFMDENKVIAERKVQTGTKHAGFDFELEIESESVPTKTVITGTTFKYWT